MEHNTNTTPEKTAADVVQAVIERLELTGIEKATARISAVIYLTGLIGDLAGISDDAHQYLQRRLEIINRDIETIKRNS